MLPVKWSSQNAILAIPVLSEYRNIKEILCYGWKLNGDLSSGQSGEVR